jgi:hypothetical protein
MFLPVFTLVKHCVFQAVAPLVRVVANLVICTCT